MKFTTEKFVPKRTFGIEMEFGNKISGKELVDVIKNTDVDHDAIFSEHYAQDEGNDFWHVKYDRSCGDILGQYGLEVATYVANSSKDLKIIGDVVKKLKSVGVNVNDRCALHIHAGAEDLNRMQVSMVCVNWVRAEHIICSMLPSHRINADYAKCLKPIFNEINKNVEFKENTLWSFFAPTDETNDYRRRSINITNYVYKNNRKTLELRSPESSLEEIDVKNWTRFFLRFINCSSNQAFSNNLQPYTLEEFLQFLNLEKRTDFLLLSSALFELKLWLCKRIVAFSKDKKLQETAQMIINNNEYPVILEDA